jgi:hypothetical protein
MGTSIYYLLQTELAVKSKDCHLLLIYIYHMCAAAAAIRELLYLMFQNYSSLLFHLSTRSCLNSVPKPAAQDIIIIIIITIVGVFVIVFLLQWYFKILLQDFWCLVAEDQFVFGSK